MYTRLTGLGTQESAWCCTRLANKALPGAVTTTSWSMPAVLRPVLSSVTRRTLMRALACDRSIQLLQIADLCKVPIP